MAYSKILADKILLALFGISDVKEKKMFGSLAFMVHGKLCVTAGKDRIMCRIDPIIHEEAIKKEGCTTVVMKGREYKGYVYVSENVLQTEADFNHWIQLALDFNKKLPVK